MELEVVVVVTYRRVKGGQEDVLKSYDSDNIKI